MGEHAKPGPVSGLVDKIKPKRKRPPQDTSEIAAWAARIIWLYARRCGDDPQGLALADELRQELADAINAAAFMANKGVHRYPTRHIAAIRDVSQPAIVKMVARGEEAYARRVQEEGGAPVVQAGPFREARARTLAAAGEVDVHGSEREQEVARQLRAVG